MAGGPTSHVAILAATLGVPMMVSLGAGARGAAERRRDHSRCRVRQSAQRTGRGRARSRARASCRGPRTPGTRTGRGRAGVPARQRRTHRSLRQSRRHGGRYATRIGAGCRGLRPAAHRVPVPGPQHRSRRSRTARELPAGRGPARCTPAGDPHPRHRRRQADCLSTAAAGGQPGAGIARHPHQPVAARVCSTCSCARFARGAAGGAHPAAHDHGCFRNLGGAGAPRRAGPRARCAGTAAGRDDRDAGRGHAGRPDRKGESTSFPSAPTTCRSTRWPWIAVTPSWRRVSMVCIRRCCASSRPRRKARPCTAARWRSAADSRRIPKPCRCC